MITVELTPEVAQRMQSFFKRSYIEGKISSIDYGAFENPLHLALEKQGRMERLKHAQYCPSPCGHEACAG